MASTTAAPRKAAVREIVARSAPASRNGDTPHGKPTSEFFGINTFGARQMRDALPKKVYQKFLAAVRLGKKLDNEIAPVVADAIKTWAISAPLRRCSSPSSRRAR